MKGGGSGEREKRGKGKGEEGKWKGDMLYER